MCNHEMSILSDMVTLKVDRDYYYRTCTVCGEAERLPRAGKIWSGVSIQAETFRDTERRQFAKEHLQGHEPDGTVNPLFREAYGDPEKRGKTKLGSKMDEYALKE